VLVDLVESGLDRVVQFGVFGQDQDAALVFVGGVEVREVDLVELTGRGGHREPAPFLAAHGRRRYRANRRDETTGSAN
jgi:hypothetical protein